MTVNAKISYREGTWFAVPLRAGGYAVGVVARAAGDGRTFGYFFGPRRDELPTLGDVEGLAPKHAVWVGRFGDLGLLNGEWRILGESGNWDRSLWPLPPFIRIDDTRGTALKAVYSDDLELISEEPCDPGLRETLPKDALSGYGAVEKRLTRRLGS